MSANEFSSVDDELAHYKNRYLELKEEFDEMVSMNREYEAEMEQQVVELEQKEKGLKADNMRITQELEQYRTKNREKEQTQDSEISRLKKLLEEEIQMKRENAAKCRSLEQELDDYDRKYRHIATSFEDMQKNYEAEVERNALLETEVSEGVKLKELLQREKDEKRDLKSELEIRTRIPNAKSVSDDQKPTLPRPEIIEERPSESLPVPVDKPSGSIEGVRSPAFVSGVASRRSQTIPNLSSHASNKTPRVDSSSRESPGSSQRLSALTIVGDLLRKVGALETKLASCRTFVRQSSDAVNTQISTTPRRGDSMSRSNNSFSSSYSGRQSRGTPEASRIGERLDPGVSSRNRSAIPFNKLTALNIAP